MSAHKLEQLAVTQLLTNSSHIVCVIDFDMVVQWISDSAQGYGVEALGRNVADVVHVDDVARVAQAFPPDAQTPGFEPSHMSNSIMTARVLTTNGYVAFDASGRWITDDDGDRYLMVVIQEVATRHATDLALRKLAAGANQQDMAEAIITAAHAYGGVQGAQLIWQAGFEQQTFGDLYHDAAAVFEAWGDLGGLREPTDRVAVAGSTWCYALPVMAGGESLATLVVWGGGSVPHIALVVAAMEPLVDLAAVSITRLRDTAELERRASTDQVTGLLNRYAFFSEIEDIDVNSAVMYIDLDGFKAVNDKLGHTLGDQLLAVISEQLREAVGVGCLVGRLGGDEFAVFCSAANEDAARTTGQVIVQALNQTFVIDGHHVATGASIGVAFADQAISGVELVDAADKALLQAKAEGKGRVVLAVASSGA